MAGIAGIVAPGRRSLVETMLAKIEHRGGAGREIFETDGATFGIVWTKPQERSIEKLRRDGAVADQAGNGRLAKARFTDDGLVLRRDHLGVAPLYYGETEEEGLCFASEVKALLDVCAGIGQVPAGHEMRDGGMRPYYTLEKKEPLTDDSAAIAAELKRRLVESVDKRIALGGTVGCWLSGGLDSSAMAALARPRMKTLRTFAAGLEGAPDLKYARMAADFIDSEHHEVVPSLRDLLAALPKVIYHLESFDALLVRSSITNYLVAERSSEHVDAVFSGEGGDELFAGYDYLKAIDRSGLADELIDITGRLADTALQRVDRSASAHGTVAYVAFLDPDVVDYALRIPVEYKLRGGVEKWILRRALDGELPAEVLNRKKAKFWQGAGIEELLSDYAEGLITDDDFRRERRLPNDWEINTKEELFYYRIFREHFGELDDVSWMGRTKGAPKN
ncbi:MAG TPA: asparagine synthase [Candidatus Eisenbacteria bacterium]|uniref:asparagine synthase (glutamine-hydrolyzing) n=1 Tax=Eiseniibacteriota bacterium TaxID=2212470 RepID=A0A7V2F3T3_UNCEI|nr:asparagine synthase [Candidatus Eisenbacteria bacterium]